MKIKSRRKKPVRQVSFPRDNSGVTVVVVPFLIEERHFDEWIPLGNGGFMARKREVS